MKWIDAAKVDADRANDENDRQRAAMGMAPAPEEERAQYRAGLCYRPDDGTRHGRWRVAAEHSESDARWIVWDLRREDSVGKARPVQVIGRRFNTPQGAMIFAEACDRIAPLRYLLAVVRGLAWTVLSASDEVEVTRRERAR